MGGGTLFELLRPDTATSSSPKTYLQDLARWVRARMTPFGNSSGFGMELRPCSYGLVGVEPFNHLVNLSNVMRKHAKMRAHFFQPLWRTPAHGLQLDLFTGAGNETKMGPFLLPSFKSVWSLLPITSFGLGLDCRDRFPRFSFACAIDDPTDREADRVGEAGDRVFVQTRRERAGFVRGKWQHAHCGGADRATCVPDA
jgi:hypothetical protein